MVVKLHGKQNSDKMEDVSLTNQLTFLGALVLNISWTDSGSSPVTSVHFSPASERTASKLDPWPAGEIWTENVNGQQSPLPQLLPLNCPGARHLTPYLYCCIATISTRLIAGQLTGMNVAVQWRGCRSMQNKKHHAQAVKTFLEQINIWIQYYYEMSLLLPL